jgi:formylglycine-generating enzyme required for sulfatase activity
VSNLEHYKESSVENILLYAQSDVSFYGVKNMGGNVQEWTATEFRTESLVMERGEQDFSNAVLSREEAEARSPQVIVRGGSWINDRSWGMGAKRRANSIGTWRPELGFRCICPKVGSCNTPWDWRWIWLRLD